MRGVADDEDVPRGEIDAVEFAGPLAGEGAEAVPVVGVVCEGAESEVALDAVVAELEFGAGTEIAGEEADRDMGQGGHGVEDLWETGEQAAIGAGELGLQVVEVATEE